jgi:hypothetical protein
MEDYGYDDAPAEYLYYEESDEVEHYYDWTDL